MKRKFWTVFLTIAIAVCMSFGFAACGEAEKGQDGKDGVITQEGTEGLQYQKRKDEEGNEYAAVVGLGTAWDTDIVIPSTYRGLPVKEIGDHAFSLIIDVRNGSLTSVTISEGVIAIGMEAFFDCSLLAEITIPQSVTSIGLGAFSGCIGLAEITIPDSVSAIEDRAFESCRGLTSITIPNGVTSIGSDAFAGCDGLSEIVIPENVTLIGEDALEDCDGLQSVIWNAENCATEDSPFIGCGKLNRVIFGKNVKSIPDNAFSNCRGLTTVTIGSNVTSIGEEAFSNCPKLIEIWNYSGLEIKPLSSDLGYVAYYAKHVYKDDTPSIQTVVDDYIFYEEGEESYLLGYVGAETKLTLPAHSPTGKNYAIYQYAFCDYSGLTSIDIPNSVTSIGSFALMYCSRLAAIVIGSGVTEIGERAFYMCGDLTEIIIPDNVTEIGDEAFARCSDLNTVTIGSGLTTIGVGAFGGCIGLKEVYFENPNGWTVNGKSILGLEDSAVAADCLIGNYYDCYGTWQREG